MKPSIILPLEDAYFLVNTLKSATRVYSGMLMRDDIGEITRQILLQELSDANKAIGTLESSIPNNIETPYKTAKGGLKMTEYIEREKVYHKLTGVCDGYCHAKMCKFTEYMLEEIEDIPAADVQPVKHSSWESTAVPITDPDGVSRRCVLGYKCKACGNEESRKKPYCGGCGAEMSNPEE